MSRLRRGVLNTTHDRVLDAVVIDVVRDRCSVRLADNGQTLHGLRYSGGPLASGDHCKVTYASGAPMVLGMGRASTVTVERRPVRTRMVIPDYRPSDLGGWTITPHTHGGTGGGDLTPSIRLFKAATVEYMYYDADEAGLNAANTEAVAGDSIKLPEVDITLSANITFKDDVVVYGSSTWSSRILGQVKLGESGDLYNLSVWNIASSSDPVVAVIGPPTTGALLWGCAIRAINTGTGDAVCVEHLNGWTASRDSYFRATAADPSATATIFRSTGTGTAEGRLCELANNTDLDSAPDDNWEIDDGNDTFVPYGCTWHTGYTYTPAVYRIGDRAATDHTHDDRYYTETELQTSGQAQVHWGNVTNQPKFQAIFTVEGALEVGSGEIRIGNHTGRTLTISAVYLDVNTAPASQAIIVDIHKNGTTIFTNQANRPQIAAGANAGNTTTVDASSWANGDYLTMDIDQVGVGTTGENLTATVVYS